MNKHPLAVTALLIFISSVAFAFKPATNPDEYQISIYGAKVGAYEKDYYGLPLDARFDHQPTLKEAIEKAGGFNVFSNKSRVWVIEQLEDKDPVLYDLSDTKKIEKVLLANHSIIVIQQTQMLFTERE